LASTQPPKWHCSPPLAICHDLGQTEEFIGNERFEVDGADAAVNWLRSRGVEDSRTETVWDAIALHIDASIAVRKRPEISLVVHGAAADILGPPEDIAATEVTELMRTIPRVNMKRDYLRVVAKWLAGVQWRRYSRISSPLLGRNTSPVSFKST
jgi:hypothetical protein